MPPLLPDQSKKGAAGMGRIPAKKRTDPAGRILNTGERFRKQDQRYLYRYKDAYGEERQIYANTLLELREKEKHIQRDLLDGIRTGEAQKITLNLLFDGFIQRKRREVRPSTIRNYKDNWKLVADRIGDIPITKIRTSTLDNLFSELADEGRAKSCINQARKLIRSCLDKAVADDLIRKNPADYVGKVTGTVKTVNALTADQQERLLEFAKGDAYSHQAPFLTFALETGLRCGELCALQWSDIDYDNNCIHVTKQLQDLPGKDGKPEKHIVELKTDAGCRDIPLNATITQALTAEKKRNVQLGIRSKETVDGLSDFVFLTVNGLTRNHNSVFTFLRRMITAYNKAETKAAEKEKREPELLPKISAHVLRHSAITNWANSGMSLKTLQYLAGHKNVHLTLNVYADADMQRVKEEFSTLTERRAQAI